MRKISRVRAERASEWDETYPTPSQIALRIGAAMLVALCIAIAANAFVGA
ncbi:MAG TPA: hypothetical protein VGH40_03165 [Roseiarcus sp.]|jgi:hypothetical protein